MSTKKSAADDKKATTVVANDPDDLKGTLKHIGACLLDILEAPLPLLVGKANELEPRRLALSAGRATDDDQRAQCRAGCKRSRHCEIDVESVAIGVTDPLRRAMASYRILDYTGRPTPHWRNLAIAPSSIAFQNVSWGIDLSPEA